MGKVLLRLAVKSSMCTVKNFNAGGTGHYSQMFSKSKMDTSSIHKASGLQSFQSQDSGRTVVLVERPGRPRFEEATWPDTSDDSPRRSCGGACRSRACRTEGGTRRLKLRRSMQRPGTTRTAFICWRCDAMASSRGWLSGRFDDARW